MVSTDGAFRCVTLERSVDGDHPCIPVGVYPVTFAIHHPTGPHPYRCPLIEGVPGRSEIHIHIANNASELLGCIAVGLDVSPDRQSIEHSQAAFDALMKYLEGVESWTIEILDPPAHD